MSAAARLVLEALDHDVAPGPPVDDRPDSVAAAAFVHVMAGEYDAADALLATTTGADPLADAMRDYVAALCRAEVPGRLERHLAGRDLDPVTASTTAYVAVETAMISGQIAVAGELARTALERPLEPVARVWTRIVHGRALIFLGRLPESETEIQGVLDDPAARRRSSRIALAVRGLLAGLNGHPADLGRTAEELRLELPDPRYYADVAPFILLALGYAACGSPTAAAEILLHGAGGERLPRLPLPLRGYGYDVLVESALVNAEVVRAHGRMVEYDALPLGVHPMATAARERARSRLDLVLRRYASSQAAANLSADLAAEVGGELYVVRARILRAMAAASDVDPGPGRFDRAARDAALADSGAVRAWATRELHAVGRNLRVFPSIGWDLLTPQQRIVAVLVAQGRSNRQVAEELYLSPRTVEGHVAAILDQLGADRREGIVSQVPVVADRPLTPPPSLTDRQLEVAMLVADGMSNQRVAERLGISEKTVEKHLRAVFGHLGAGSRAEVAARLRATTSDRGSGVS